MGFLKTFACAIFLLVLPSRLPAQDRPWFQVAGQDFLLFTDTSEAKGLRLAADLESRLAAFEEAFGPVPSRQLPIEVFLFRNEEDFIQAVPAGGKVNIDKSAYLLKGPDRVFVVARDKSPDDIANDVGHALGHLFFERLVLWRPFWLAEGAAEFFRKVGRDPDTKRIPADQAFSVTDLLKIVPSATYQDQEPAGVFRIQAYRLLSIVLKDHRPALRDFLEVLRTENGNRAIPAGIDNDAVNGQLAQNVETRIGLPAAVSASPVRAADSGNVAIHQGDLFLATDRPSDAARYYNADTKEARAARAILTRFSRAGGEATRALDRTARELPEAGLVQFHFGSIQATAPADIQLQVQALERAVKLLPLMGRAHAELARVYTLAGRAEESLPAIERAIQLEPEFADRFYELRAEALLSLRRVDEAYATIQMAAALPHSDRPAVEAYDRKVADIAKRIENLRREADAEKMEQLRAEVKAKADVLEPPKPVVPPAPLRTGLISYQIESTVRVEVAQQVFPEYPDALVQSGKAGTVTLQVNVGADGRVTRATVVNSQVSELNAATIDAVKKWSFTPVERAGRSVSFDIRLIFQYAVQ